MDELFAGIAVLVDGRPSDPTLLGVSLLLVVSLVRRTLIRVFHAFAVKISSFRLIYRRKGGSILVDVRVGGSGLWVWWNIYWRRR